MLKEVSTTTEPRSGFTQSSYKKNQTHSTVLLFDVKKGTVLPSHKHDVHQFGYTFYGEYDFVIGGKRYLTVGRDSYHIESGIYHSIVANTDCYAMDFKYMGSGRLASPLSLNIIKDVVDCTGARRGEIRFSEAASGSVRTMLLQGDANYSFTPAAHGLEQLLVVSRNAEVIVNGHSVQLERMKIYKVAEELTSLDITIFGNGAEAFLYEI